MLGRVIVGAAYDKVRQIPSGYVVCSMMTGLAIIFATLAVESAREASPTLVTSLFCLFGFVFGGTAPVVPVYIKEQGR